MDGGARFNLSACLQLLWMDLVAQDAAGPVDTGPATLRNTPTNKTLGPPHFAAWRPGSPKPKTLNPKPETLHPTP